MLDIFGKNYYIDIDEIIKKCRPDYGTQNFDEKKQLVASKDENGETILELNIFKFEIFKACVERILNEYEPVDNALGEFGAKDSTAISFKMAYNTLLKYEILIEDDSE